LILQALVRRYQDAGGERPGWKKRETDFAVNIDSNGNILTITPLEEEIEIPNGKNKDGGDRFRKVKRRQTLSLPATETRTAGILPYFLSDKAEYILGAKPGAGTDTTSVTGTDTTSVTGTDATPGIEQKKFEAARKLHTDILENTAGDAAAAIVAFFSKTPALPRGFQLPDTKNDCVFMVNGQYAHEDKAVQAAWDSYYASQSSKNEIIRDLITGEADTLWRKQESIALRGVTMGKQALVSINSESFSSYGQAAYATETAKRPAAQLGKKSSIAYATALNDMLASDKHHKSLSGDTLVYWAEGPDGGEDEAEVFSWTFEPEESDDTKISALMDALSSGSPVQNCDLDRPFYLLCLSPNGGRISVRYFHRDSFGNILKNNALHYEQMNIATSSKQENFPYSPPWIILGETTVSKKAGDAVPLLGGQLINAIVAGSRYPMTLYNAILIRIRAGEAINRTKAAIVKAVLIRNYNEQGVTTVGLNTQSGNIPYILGRLFSVLERLQEKANGSATIRRGYFATACANPANVFPTILKLSVHHADKLDNATFFEKLKTELLGTLDPKNPFPTTFDLDDQGRFILGYYHQTQDFFTKKENKTEVTTNV
jgi:CRISPR-associated protein Csd1